MKTNNPLRKEIEDILLLALAHIELNTLGLLEIEDKKMDATVDKLLALVEREQRKAVDFELKAREFYGDKMESKIPPQWRNDEK